MTPLTITRCCACTLASAVLAASAAASQTKKQDDTSATVRPAEDIVIPELVGYNVVAQVDDVRETVGDLLEALQNAGGGFGYANWKTQEFTLKDLKAKVDLLESWIDRKQRLDFGASWASYVNSPDYGTWIHGTVRDLGDVLTKIARGMEGSDKVAGRLPFAVADNVVEQVDDVRETVGDLIEALEIAGKGFYHFGWAEGTDLLSKYKRELATIEESLDAKKALADEEWTTWLGGNVYKVTVHQSISLLGEIMTGLGNALAGKASSKESKSGTTH